jgi:hypothetical protein
MTVNSGNVFTDVGIPEPDVDPVKADLAVRVQRLAQRRRLTPDEAAALLKVPHPIWWLCSREGSRPAHSISCCGS